MPLAPLLAIAVALSVGKASWKAIFSVLLVLVVIAWPSYVAERQPDARGTNAYKTIDIIDKYGRDGDVISTAINFGFSWSVERYLLGDTRFSFAPSSDGRIWVTEPSVECDRLAEFEVATDSFLILCSNLPPGWDEQIGS